MNDITVKNLKLHPIIDLKETYTYKGNGHFQRINTPSQTVALWEVQMEDEVVKPLKPIFYKLYVDDSSILNEVIRRISFFLN